MPSLAVHSTQRLGGGLGADRRTATERSPALALSLIDAYCSRVVEIMPFVASLSPLPPLLPFVAGVIVLRLVARFRNR